VYAAAECNVMPSHMSVEQSEIIDLLSFDKKSGDVVLTISDHIDWQDSAEHQRILQAQLNTYLAFVEGGQLLVEKPEARGRRITFAVVFKFRPDRDGRAFLERAAEVIRLAGFAFTWEVFALSYDNKSDMNTFRSCKVRFSATSQESWSG